MKRGNKKPGTVKESTESILQSHRSEKPWSDVHQYHDRHQLVQGTGNNRRNGIFELPVGRQEDVKEQLSEKNGPRHRRWN